MRAVYGTDILIDKDGNFYGFCLNAAYVAEHEWGIKSLHKAYGVSAIVNEQKTGYETCLNTIFPVENLIMKDFTADGLKYSLLVSLKNYMKNDEIKFTKSVIQDYELYPYTPDSMRCAWDEHSFGITVPAKYKNYLKEIYQAMANLDCVIILDKGELPNEEKINPFAKNYGLCIMINSKIPKELKEYRSEKDLDKFRLYKAMAETGIEKTLKNAGKHYFALSPKWKDESKTELIFWLNPMEQHLYNFGWMTIQDLLDWTENKGKVMKN